MGLRERMHAGRRRPLWRISCRGCICETRKPRRPSRLPSWSRWACLWRQHLRYILHTCTYDASLRNRNTKCCKWQSLVHITGVATEFLVQGAFEGGSCLPSWLLDECRSVLDRITASGKAQAGLAAGALAGLSAAFAACKVPFNPFSRYLWTLEYMDNEPYGL